MEKGKIGTWKKDKVFKKKFYTKETRKKGIEKMKCRKLQCNLQELI